MGDASEPWRVASQQCRVVPCVWELHLRPGELHVLGYWHQCVLFACLLKASVFRGSGHLTLGCRCMHECWPRHVLSVRLLKRVRLGLSYVIIISVHVLHLLEALVFLLLSY